MKQGISMSASVSAASHPFDQALALLTPRGAAGDVLDGQPHPAYGNMVGPYGGMTAAQMLQAVLLHPRRLGEPVALTVNFAAGLRDAPFVIEARPVRTNRSTQHWTVALSQAGDDGAPETMITATALTAARRQTWSATDAPMPAVPRPAEITRQQFPVRRVRWIERYEMRPVTGHMPHQWDGAESDSITQLWMRDDPLRTLDFAGLTALADVFFPRVWRRRAVMTPIGTVSMTVYFHAGASELAANGDGYLLGQARAQSFFNGFFDQSAELWNEAGQLLATTHQIVYYKE
jgi:acyl-CoA thioesterase